LQQKTQTQRSWWLRDLRIGSRVPELAFAAVEWGIIEKVSGGLAVQLGRKELGCEEKTSCVLQLQWDWYSSFVEIRCRETDSGDCNRLRTLVCVVCSFSFLEWGETESTWYVAY
jgi:hypothetical protein